MFLALGVGAWASSVFHLMTHAFFKALLFLGAGAVIFSLHHEHNILKMGGLRTRLPVAFWSFMIGSAALAALPLTSGFYSKDAILLSAYHASWNGPLLWGVGLLGALLTSIYSFRLVFLVFFGEVKTEPEAPANWGRSCFSCREHTRPHRTDPNCHRCHTRIGRIYRLSAFPKAQCRYLGDDPIVSGKIIDSIFSQSLGHGLAL